MSRDGFIQDIINENIPEIERIKTISGKRHLKCILLEDSLRRLSSYFFDGTKEERKEVYDKYVKDILKKIELNENLILDYDELFYKEINHYWVLKEMDHIKGITFKNLKLGNEELIKI